MLSIRRKTIWASPWVFQTVRWGPLVAMRRRDKADSAYDTEDGPYRMVSVTLRLRGGAKLQLQFPNAR